ncbi:substrate-binding periplasmic protein [Kiloniella sp.]|uniref:substrate-binding periplasmic protein n=1 Tax=Kiloniella sp. TaxID=1938587 RepID=UPI003B013558
MPSFDNHSKRRFINFVLALLVTSFWVLAPQTSNAEPIVLVTGDYPPFDMQNSSDGKRGFDVEVAEAAFKAVGLEAQTSFVPWKRAMVMIEKGEATAVITCAYREERASFAIWSDPISEASVTFVIRKDQKDLSLEGVSSLQQHTVVTVSDYATDKELTGLGIPHEKVNSMKEGLLVVANGNAEVFYVGTEAAKFVAQENGLSSKLDFLPVAGAKIVPFHICLSKEWPNYQQVNDQFNEGLKIIRQNGEFARIRSNYGG